MPYLFVAAIWVVPISECFYKWDVKEIFRKFVLCSSPSQLWFLWMLFWVFMLAWILWKYLSSSLYVGIVVSLLLYCAGIIGERIIPNIFCIWTALEYMPFFYMGIYLYEKKKTMDEGMIPAICWGLVDVLLFIINLKFKTCVYLSIIIEFVLHFVGSIMTFLSLQYIAERVNWRNSKIVITLFKYSMPMYLFHQQLIYIVIFWLNGKVNPYVNAGTNFFISVIVALIISWLLMRFKTTRFLIGEK